MAKQTINLGTGELTGDGESIRSAFDKINSNFDELYTQDSNDVVLSAINAHIIPDTDVAYDLGSASNRFRDLYLSGSTIDLGGTTLSIVGGELQLGGVKVPTTADVAATVASAVSAPTGDLTGSVFADDSTLLVDAVNGVIPWSVIDGAPTLPTFDQTLDTTDEVAFAAVSVGNLRVAPTGSGVELLNSTNDIVITAQDDFTVSTTTGDINLNTTAGSVGIDATGGLLQMQGQNGVDISSANGDIDLNAFSNNIVFKSPVVGLVGDITGSVFADDSTLLVDGVAGKIVGNIDTAQTAIFKDSIVLQNGNDTIVIGDAAGTSFQLPNKGFSLQGGGVGGGNYVFGLTANGNGSIVTTNQFNLLSGAGMAIGTSTGLTIQGTVTVDAAVTAPSFVGDLTGSVLLDDSTVVIDGTSGNITGNIIQANGALNALGGLGVNGTSFFYGDITISDNSSITSNGDAYFGEGISVPSISSSLVNSNNLNINAEQNVIITADTDGLTPRVWNFNTDGTLDFPDSTTQSTAYVERFVSRSRFTSNQTITDSSANLLQFNAYQGSLAFNPATYQWTPATTGLYRIDFVLGLTQSEVNMPLTVFLYNVTAASNQITLFNGTFSGSVLSMSGTVYLMAGQNFQFGIIQQTGDDIILDKDLTSAGIEELTRE